MKTISPGSAVVAALALGIGLIPTKSQSGAARFHSVGPPPIAVTEGSHLHCDNDPGIVLQVGRAASEAYTATSALTMT
jgi:hypothetical protein